MGGTAAYLPARYVKRYLDAGQLHLVHDAPIFPYPVWALFRDDLPVGLRDAAVPALRGVATEMEGEPEAVLDALEGISDGVEVLGER